MTPDDVACAPAQLEIEPATEAVSCTPSALRRNWPILVLPLLVLAIYLPHAPRGFMGWDDWTYILDNQHLRSLDGLRRIWTTFELPQYYPLTFTSYWLEFQLWGARPEGYYYVNVLGHALNALLVYALVRALGAGRGVAWLTAALFALHPLQIASVAWLPERKNVLSGLFALSSAVLYLRSARRSSVAEYWIAIAAFAAALLSKTAVLPLPVSLFLAERLVFGSSTRASVRRVLPLLVLSAAAAAVTIVKEHQAGCFGPEVPCQPLLAPTASWFYLRQLCLPLHLPALYPPWMLASGSLVAWLPLAALVAAGAALWRLRTRLGGTVIWGCAHFLIMLLPVLGIVPFGYLLLSPVADHFLYIALIGPLVAVFTIAAALIGRVPQVAKLAYALGAVLCVLAGARTWRHLPVWRDAKSLWTYTLQQNPHCSVAYMNMGVVMARAGMPDRAVRAFRDALTYAPQDAPWRYAVETNLANVLLTTRPREAVTHARAAVKLAPQDPVAHRYLGQALAASGDFSSAIDSLRTAVQLEPNDPVSLDDLARAYAAAGYFPDAITTATAARQRAQAEHNTPLAHQIEDCLRAYRAGRTRPDSIGGDARP